ncbi:MAG: exodeoxyribonuclease VII small subunit [Bacteroidota bacterium]
MSKAKQTDSGKLEAHLSRIKQILQLMQQAEQGFDQQMELFQEGIKLIHQSQDILEQSELHVKQLLEGEMKPFLPAKGEE